MVTRCALPAAPTLSFPLSSAECLAGTRAARGHLPADAATELSALQLCKHNQPGNASALCCLPLELNCLRKLEELRVKRQVQRRKTALGFRCHWSLMKAGETPPLCYWLAALRVLIEPPLPPVRSLGKKQMRLDAPSILRSA